MIRLWGEDGFTIRNHNDGPCWGSRRDKGEDFFRDAEQGEPDVCSQNWYEGSPSSMGDAELGAPAQVYLVSVGELALGAG